MVLIPQGQVHTISFAWHLNLWLGIGMFTVYIAGRYQYMVIPLSFYRASVVGNAVYGVGVGASALWQGTLLSFLFSLFSLCGGVATLALAHPIIYGRRSLLL